MAVFSMRRGLKFILELADAERDSSLMICRTRRSICLTRYHDASLPTALAANHSHSLRHSIGLISPGFPLPSSDDDVYSLATMYFAQGLQRMHPPNHSSLELHVLNSLIHHSCLMFYLHYAYYLAPLVAVVRRTYLLVDCLACSEDVPQAYSLFLVIVRVYLISSVTTSIYRVMIMSYANRGWKIRRVSGSVQQQCRFVRRSNIDMMTTRGTRTAVWDISYRCLFPFIA